MHYEQNLNFHPPHSIIKMKNFTITTNSHLYTRKTLLKIPKTPFCHKRINMGTHCKVALLIVYVALAVAIYGNAQDTLVPAIITFGDSAVDVGNNDYIHTFFKANYPPYGRDFVNSQPTGRFCNGRLATDITAETLGFTSYPPAYLSPQAFGNNLLIGANFASAGSGYDDKTSMMSHAISLSQQLEYYREYQGKLAQVAGSQRAAAIVRDSLYILSAGSSDFLQNYYVNPLLYKAYTVDQYSTYLVGIFSSFVRELHGLGARRIGANSAAPLGCVPAARTLFGHHESGCVARLNTDAQNFNHKLDSSATTLRNQLPGLKIAVFNIFNPLYDIIQRPSDHGFTEATRGCCGTGTIETTVFLCNPKSPGTCSNASTYVFWDAVHPSEATNQALSDTLISQGIDLVT